MGLFLIISTHLFINKLIVPIRPNGMCTDPGKYFWFFSRSCVFLDRHVHKIRENEGVFPDLRFSRSSDREKGAVFPDLKIGKNIDPEKRYTVSESQIPFEI